MAGAHGHVDRHEANNAFLKFAGYEYFNMGEHRGT
jgi:hypothetical protein